MMGSTMGAMGAWMLLSTVAGVVLFVAMIALGLGMIQRLTGDHAPRGTIDHGAATEQAAVNVPDRAASDTLRASDADRQHTVAVLQRNTAAGRLSTDELDDRVAAAYSARTLGDLRRLMADLPEGLG